MSALAIRVRLLLAKGLVGEAIDALRVALRIDPANAEAWLLLGIAEEDRQDFIRAADAFDQAFERGSDPRFALRAALARSLDRTLDPAQRAAAGRRAQELAATATDGPDWDRYRDHLHCLAEAPFDHYQRIFMAQDPATGQPMSGDAAWYFRADGQLSDSDGSILDRLVAKIARGPLRIVEIGSAAGLGSTRIFGAHVKRLGGELFCIDPWEPIYNADAYEVFCTNMRLLSLGGIVSPLRMTSRAASAAIADASCDLVFIDGDHRYDAIRDDIALWRAKVRPGGVLCGDDCEGRPDDFDAAALEAHKNDDAARLRRTDGRVQDVHCGVVLAVAEALKDDYEVLGDPPGLWLTRVKP